MMSDDKQKKEKINKSSETLSEKGTKEIMVFGVNQVTFYC